MIRTAAPKLRMLAGPNGSGKSTLFRYLRDEFEFPFGYCLNPDDIDRELINHGRLYVGGWGLELDRRGLSSFLRRHGLASKLKATSIPKVVDGGLVASANYRPGYFTSVFCDYLRQRWVEKEESFTFETVMSHPDRVSALRQAHRRGYRTYLYYICTDSVLINADRIRNRVRHGGHDVPAAAIAERYDRSLHFLPGAIAASTRTYLFDNSARRHRLIAEYDEGKLVRVENDLPRWFVNAVLRK